MNSSLSGILEKHGIKPGTDPLGQGVEATIYPLDAERVLRVYKKPAEKLQLDPRIMQDFYASLDSSATSFRVPKIISVETEDGITTTVDSRFEGRDLDMIYDSLETHVRRKVLSSYIGAAQHIQLLRSPYPYFGEILTPNPLRGNTWSDFLSKKLQSVYQEGKESIDRDLPEAESVFNFMQDNLMLFDGVTEARLVHGDYYVSNALVVDNSISAVLDFNDLTVAGDFRMDVSSAVIFLGDGVSGSRDADRTFLIEKLVSQYGSGIKDVIHFYRLYYAFIFGAHSKDSGTDIYRWALKTMAEHASGKWLY